MFLENVGYSHVPTLFGILNLLKVEQLMKALGALP